MPPIAFRAVLACLLVLLLGCCATATAKLQQPRGGVIHACLVTKGGKGLARGTLRIVPGPRSCKARRGERAVAWNLRGPAGAPGAAGAPGSNGSPGGAGPAGPAGSAGGDGAAGGDGERGPAGADGPIGATGPAGQVEQSLLETIQSQADQINALDADLKALGQELVDVKGTVATVEGTVAGLGGAVGTVQGSLGGLKGTVTGLEGSLGGVEGGLKALETNVAGVKGTVKTLQDTVAGSCSQLTAVTSQVNKVSTAVGGLSLNSALTLLGGLLNVPVLPKALDPYTCS